MNLTHWQLKEIEFKEPVRVPGTMESLRSMRATDDVRTRGRVDAIDVFPAANLIILSRGSAVRIVPWTNALPGGVPILTEAPAEPAEAPTRLSGGGPEAPEASSPATPARARAPRRTSPPRRAAR